MTLGWLKSVVGGPGAAIAVEGGARAADGGGGLFVWGGAGTPEDGGVVVGGWHRMFNGAVCPEWFGAVGDGVTDDTVAVQKAVTLHPSVFLSGTYAVSAPIVLTRTVSLSGHGQKTASGLKAIARMSSCLTVSATDCVIDGLVFDANRLATDAVLLSTSNGATFRGVDFKHALRHGLNAGAGNNNSVSFYKCNARLVGTTYTGTAVTVAGSADIQLSPPVDLSSVEHNAYIVIDGVAPQARKPGDPFIVSSWASSGVASCTFPATSSATATATYTLHSGNGFNEAYAGVGGNDNNVWHFDHCYAVGCSKAGWQIDVLYGPQMNACAVDASFIAVKIGTRSGSSSVAPQGTTILRGYFEGCTYDVVIEASDGTVIADPIASSTTTIWSPDTIGSQSVTLICKGRVVSDARMSELVNASVVQASSQSGTTLFLSSTAAANITQMLPDSGDLVAGVSGFLVRQEFVTGDLGGKTITFKTASAATTINGVPGTTGVTVSGSYKSWTAVWCINKHGWVIA